VDVEVEAEVVEEKEEDEQEEDKKEEEENNCDKIQQPSPGRWGKMDVEFWVKTDTSGSPKNMFENNKSLGSNIVKYNMLFLSVSVRCRRHTKSILCWDLGRSSSPTVARLENKMNCVFA